MDRAAPPSRTHLTLPCWLLLGLPLLTCAPILALPYLPMTDFPQHLAVATMLREMGNPAYGFSAYYSVDLGRTLYLLPYGLSLLFGLVLPLRLAMQLVVFLAAVLYPLAVLRLLRVLRKPPELVLLSLPLVYNSAFFWGFTNFNLALALALFAISLMAQARRTPRQEVALALLGGVQVFIHVYGLALVLGFAALRRILGPPVPWRRFLLPLGPALVGAAIWPWPGDDAVRGSTAWPSLLSRLVHLPQEIFGAHQGRLEVPLLAGLLAAALLLGLPRWSRRGWSRLPWAEQSLALLVGVNALLYLVLPLHTPGAKFIHFRHAVLAAALLPPLLPGAALLRPQSRAWARVLVLAVALFALLGNGLQLVRFHREARPFEHMIARLPARPRVLSLILEPHGQVMRSNAYLHFAAYIQARKGGLISSSFARFWNIPVRPRRGVRMPRTPGAFEWRPQSFNYRRFGYFYGFVLVRTASPGTFVPSARFPYRLVHRLGPWQLYRRDRSLRPPGLRRGPRPGAGPRARGRPRKPRPFSE